MDSNGIGDLGKFDFMNKGMYPMSQIDRSYYATPTQSPLAAQSAQGDYDPATNPLTGEPIAHFEEGGIAGISRYNGKYGSSVFSDDPNNFAADLTKAYKTLFGRDPSQEELRTNVDALNRNPDAYGWIVNKLAESPEVDQAVKEGKIELPAGDPDVGVTGKDALATELLAGYGKFTPTPEPGGFQGFMNKAGPYLPLAMAAAAFAAPALGAAAAGEGAAGALTTTELMGGAGGAFVPAEGASFAIPAGSYTAAGAGAGAGEGIASIAPSATSSVPYDVMQASQEGFLLPENVGYVPEVGPLVSEAGAGGSGISNLTFEDALKTKLMADMVTGGSGGQGGTGGSTTTTSTPFSTGTGASPYTLQYNPNANNLFSAAGLTNEGYYGYKPTTYGYDYGIKPLALRAPNLSAYSRGYAHGGIADLGGYAAGGKLLKGPGDGMSDSIVANIGGKQPARLADGEFVIPADVVSHLGNGSTDAGAKQLYKMMDRVRHARTGNKKQGKQINPSKFLPKG